MKYLLDTHLLLWVAANSRRLTEDAKKIITNDKNILFFSAASIWEVAIKQKLKKDDFKFNASLLRRGLLDNGYNELPIQGLHTLAIENLQDHHKDPFDRILLAQASVEGFILLSSDKQMAQYGDLVHLV